MNAFLTGSRVYGSPKEDSDLDLVVLVATASDANALAAMSETKGPVRYGKLNLIVLTSQSEFDAWLAATYRCISLRPINREQAIKIIDNEFITRGLPPRHGYSGE